MTEPVKIYSATHGLGRTSICTADADDIVRRVNAVTAGNGDSLYRERVQSELDALADADVQDILQLSVVETIVSIDE